MLNKYTVIGDEEYKLVPATGGTSSGTWVNIYFVDKKTRNNYWGDKIDKSHYLYSCCNEYNRWDFS
jgi:hypothetical protein